jgi:hypothetical protein
MNIRFISHSHSMTPGRRNFLRRTLGLTCIMATGCGGSGSNGGGNSGSIVAGVQPTERLVYRNSGVAAMYDFASATELQYDPGIAPFVDPGVSISSSGLISVAQEDGNDDFSIGLFGLDGQLRDQYLFVRDVPFQTSAAVFNPAATRMAFSVDEPRSINDNTRISRVLIVDLASRSIVAEIDDVEEPVWAGSSGQLFVRQSETRVLAAFDENLNSLGPVGNFSVSPLIGGYDVSRDGRFIAHEDGSRIIAYDRNTASSWIAAEDSTGSTHSPTFSGSRW